MAKNKEISHQAIVEAAWRLARQEGIASLTMARVARAAGLTRQAIYWHFKSRTAMLLEICDYNDSLMAESATLFQGVADATAVDSLIVMMKIWLRELPSAAPLLMALNVEAMIDEEVKAAMQTRMAALSDIVENVYLRRIEAEGMLKEGMDRRQVSDFILILGSPAMWQQLTQIVGWDHGYYTQYVMDRVLELVVRPISPPAS